MTMEDALEKAKRTASTGGAQEQRQYNQERDRAGHFNELGREAFDLLFPLTSEALRVLGKIYSLRDEPFCASLELEEDAVYNLEESAEQWCASMHMKLHNKGQIGELEAALAARELDFSKMDHHGFPNEKADDFNRYFFRPDDQKYSWGLSVSWFSKKPNES